MKLPQSKGTDENVADAVAGTGFTIAEENLLLLGLQVQNLMTQTSNPDFMMTCIPHFLQRFGPDFPAISETLMPNKSADLLRYRYKVPFTRYLTTNKSANVF